MRIAILEDDLSHTELLTQWLRLAGHQTYTFEHRAQLMRVLSYESFDALLLDWNLPEMSGIEVLRQARERFYPRIPIMFVTARDQESDVVAALTAGADDFVSKPIRRLELLGRLEALGRRARGGTLAPEVFGVGPFHLDARARCITRDNEPLELTGKDFDVAALLLRNIGQVLSRSYLLEKIWRAKSARFSRSLDTHISRVRNKLQLSREHGWRLVAIYGYGYRLDQLAASAPKSQQGGLTRSEDASSGQIAGLASVAGHPASDF